MKKYISFFCLFMYILAIIGGVGYTCLSHAYVIAVAIVILGAMAIPEVKTLWKNLND